MAETTPENEPTTSEVASPGTNGIPHEPPIVVGSAEWDQLTERRAELIYKKNREGLTDAERAEYEILHERSRKAIARTFPPPDWSVFLAQLPPAQKG